MKKFIERIVPHDKALHLIGGMIGMSGLTVLMGSSGADLIVISILALILMQIPIFINEFIDQERLSKKGEGAGFSWLDILWSEIGVFIILTYTIILF